MKQLDDIIQTYQNIIRETEQKLSKEKRRIYRISTLRFILFIAGIVGVIHFWENGWLIVTGIAAITFLPFIFLLHSIQQMAFHLSAQCQFRTLNADSCMGRYALCDKRVTADNRITTNHCFTAKDC